MALKSANKNNRVETIARDDDLPLISTLDVPTIYTDGPATAEVHGQNVRVTYYELQDRDGVEVRVPVLIMIRPITSCGTGVLVRLVERSRRRIMDMIRPH